MEQTFEITVQDVPGLLARVEAIFRRQRTPIRGFFFEGGEGRAAHLTITARASGDVAVLLRKQLMRLVDVHAVADSGAAGRLRSARIPFTFKEKSA